jgi:hypothetical protein
MQKPNVLIGQCSKGHDVYVTHDLNGDIDGGTIGVDVVQPLPDGKSSEPIIVACDDCVKKVREHIV